MRIVFMGTPSFAVPSLSALADVHEVIAVYTRPDAVSGRGRRTQPSPVKRAALELGLETREPSSLRDREVQEVLLEEAPDLIVVAAFGMILPREVLEIPVLGCINVHASLLPRWRGAAPIQRAILAGDEVTGVSIMRMEEGLDTGAFCKTVTVEIDDKTTPELTVDLAAAGAEALLEALPAIEAGTVEWTDQDETRVTYADKIEKCDVALSPTDTVEVATRKVRASSDHASARLVVDGRAAAVVALVADETLLRPGAVSCTKRAMLLGFADGAARVEEVRPDGKTLMAGCEWARGARFDSVCEWGAVR